MIITSWNCHNLNAQTKEENRKNRHDYRKILQKAIGTIPDVSFFCEVEPEADDVCFYECRELDKAWDLTSGISLKINHDAGIELLEKKLLLPSSVSPKYGMALYAKVKKNNETQEIVFFWNLKRKYAKGKTIHGYPKTWHHLANLLSRQKDFWNSSAIIMGDFNLTGEEVQMKMKNRNTAMKIQWDEPTHFSSFPLTDIKAGKPLDHFICRDGVAECLSNIMLKDGGNAFVGNGLSDHLPLIIRTNKG